MPKTKTKFTAIFNAKIGKTPIQISVPVDFTNRPTDEVNQFIEGLSSQAHEQLSELAGGAKLKFANQADFKKALKENLKAATSA
jgi:hypothetical protein